jgi:hypothetical protein
MNVVTNNKSQGNSGRSPRRRSRHIYFSLVIALLILGAWGFARVTVCWGKYSWLGAIACHSQWATFVLLVASLAILGLLIRDLALPHSAEFLTGRFRRVRASWHGYRSLERWDFFHVTASSLLLIIFVLAFAWLVLASAVRF